MDSRVRGNDEIFRRTRTCCGPVGAGSCVRGIREFKRSRRPDLVDNDRSPP